MNDSFLEELELIPNDKQKTVTTHKADRHVTARNVRSSTLQRLETDELEDYIRQKQSEHAVVTVSRVPDAKQLDGKELNSKDVRKLSERDVKKQASKARVTERKEVKLKSIDNKSKVEVKEGKEEAKAKAQETRVKVIDSKTVIKDRSRRSGSCKENILSPDVSSKENSRPSDSSKESTPKETAKEKGRVHDVLGKKSDSKDKDPVALLNAIKDLISTYTKQESTKILRAMQELHLNSQASLIKNLVFQTDELVKEMHPSKDSTRVRTLMEENDKLKEDIIILQMRNEELQKRLVELEFLKEENITLKIKCKELQK